MSPRVRHWMQTSWLGGLARNVDGISVYECIRRSARSLSEILQNGGRRTKKLELNTPNREPGIRAAIFVSCCRAHIAVYMLDAATSFVPKSRFD